jgi:hypothetical protein
MQCSVKQLERIVMFNQSKRLTPRNKKRSGLRGATGLLLAPALLVPVFVGLAAAAPASAAPLASAVSLVAPTPTTPKITNYVPSMVAGTPYTFTYTADGFPAPTYTVDPGSGNGSTPPGTSLSSDGVLSGTPTTPGFYTYEVKASNDAGSFERFDSLYVYAAPSVDGTPTEATVGSAYDYGFTTGGYPAPSVALSAGTLPTGLWFTGTNHITGTPAVAGQFPLTVTATFHSGWDGYTATDTQDTALTVNPATGGQAKVATPPASLQPGAWENDSNIRVFGEKYNQVLASPLAVGGTTIPAGTKVNSYYVHADAVGNADTAHNYTGSISFGTKILAVATSTAELQATTPQFGVTGVTYSTSTDQGLEYNDAATTGSTVGKVNLTFNVYNTADAIRIITLAP